MQRIPPGIDRPENLIHGVQRIARPFRDSFQLQAGARVRRQFALRHFALQYQLRDAGSQIVMNIPGNPGALTLQ